MNGTFEASGIKHHYKPHFYYVGFLVIIFTFFKLVETHRMWYSITGTYLTSGTYEPGTHEP